MSNVVYEKRLGRAYVGHPIDRMSWCVVSRYVYLDYSSYIGPLCFRKTTHRCFAGAVLHHLLPQDTQHCGFAAAALQQLLPQDTTHSCFAAAAANGKQTLQLLHNGMGGCWPAEKSQSQLLPCSCFSRMLCSKLESSVSSQQKRLIGTWQLKIYELVTDVHELCDPMARDHRGSGSLVTVSASSLKSFVLALQVSGFWIW